ncbi:CTP:phosphocholine cytidylyltransferase [Selenomonas ruminantium]|uniref:CTP:phosphocholine cytidylyltransferase n=1 Tax=Selenomonas ruminantium TaxID=971 RepID=A0A1M6ULF1_SELRU|nr:phosphocholine cytidylyltransferase family protein [Selenomonas ruminantium]SHK70054.1 CTP:phosphocholine cytidylyltransferase [Selenomonas ruminantium]
MLKVKRAVFLAAGKGTRMAPLTDILPKPLVKVHGKPIILTLLEAVQAAGIEEIYIVRGYLGEKFDCLLADYPQIRFIDNPDYEKANNISSIVAAADYLENAYIIESDLLLSNPALIPAEQEESNYLAIPKEKSDDWCFYTDEAGCIRKMAVGGENCQQMVGISYWTAEDGARLARRAKELYADPANHQLYWDEIALSRYLPEFTIRVRQCQQEDVIEIDTLAELQLIDSSYR